MSTEEKFILSGGPDAPLIDPDVTSIGELLLKKFIEHGNNTIFVSRTILHFS